MRINTAKKRMLDGKLAIGALAGLGSPLATETLSLAGFDFVLVDNQHGSWTDDSTMLAFRSISLGAAVPMARVQQNDFYAIGRLLDRGALGIVVPMVHSVEDAQAAAFAVRYPPRGGRSVGAFGTQFHGSGYSQWIDVEVFLAVQIESQRAVEHAEEILAVDGVDGCWVGPADLANSMGVDPNTSEGAAAREVAILKVRDACRVTNKIPGIAAGKDAQHWIDEGFLFVTVGGDADFMLGGSQDTLQRLGR